MRTGKAGTNSKLMQSGKTPKHKKGCNGQRGALSYSMPAFVSIIVSAAMYSRLKVFALCDKSSYL